MHEDPTSSHTGQLDGTPPGTGGRPVDDVEPHRQESQMTEVHTQQNADTDRSDEVPAETGRRALLRKVAIGGAGAAAAAMMLDRTAQAADGDALTIGQLNTGATPTRLDVTPAAPLTEGPSALSVGGYEPPSTSPFPAAVGGYGDDTIAHGLHGSTTNAAGFGVVAASLAAAVDDETAPPAGLAVASANGPQIKFVTLDGAVSGPTPGAHGPGELYVDADGTLWFTVPVPPVPPATDPTVKFVKLAGANTAGAFHSLPVAQRVYDSREGTSPAKIAEGGTVDIDLTTNIDGDPSGFPAGSGTAVVNLTINDTEEIGFVSLFATGTPVDEVQTSNINWSAAGITLANSTAVPVSSSGSITALVGSDLSDTRTARTHVIVDLVGYYL
jgi:hypothetical protein